MRVGFFPGDNERGRWGREIHPWSRLAAGALIEAGHDVTFLNRHSLKQVSARSSLDVLHLNWPQALMQAKSSRQRRQAMRSAYRFWFIARCRFIMRKLRRAGIPVVWQVHDLPYADDPLDRELMTFLFRQFLMLADGLLFYEESAKRPFYDLFGRPRDKAVGTAPLGDYTQLHGPIKTKASARDSLAFGGAGKILFYPGTVRWTRNPASFIEAFLSHAGRNDLLIVSGRGTDRLRHLAVAERVMVKPGMIDHDEFRDLMCASDYVVNDAPQYLGSAIIRAALGYGVPVIASRFGCTEDLAEGACVPISDEPGGVDDAIHAALVMEPDRYRRMCEQAIRNHQARPWSAYATGCMRVYEEVISRRRRARIA